MQKINTIKTPMTIGLYRQVFVINGRLYTPSQIPLIGTKVIALV